MGWASTQLKNLRKETLVGKPQGNWLLEIVKLALNVSVAASKTHSKSFERKFLRVLYMPVLCADENGEPIASE